MSSSTSSGVAPVPDSRAQDLRLVAQPGHRVVAVRVQTRVRPGLLEDDRAAGAVAAGIHAAGVAGVQRSLDDVAEVSVDDVGRGVDLLLHEARHRRPVGHRKTGRRRSGTRVPSGRVRHRTGSPVAGDAPHTSRNAP